MEREPWYMILRKRLREREREREREPLGEARPPNLLNIALCGLTSTCLHPCPFFFCLGGHTLTPSVHAPSVYMQWQRKQASKQVKKQVKGKHAKRQAIKRRAKQGQTNMLSNKREFPRRSSVHYSIRLEYGWHMCHQIKFLKGTRGLVYERQVWTCTR